jgi:perosamine synthetase
LSGREIEYVLEVMRSGWWGRGPVSEHLEGRLRTICGSGTNVLALSSCTAALHLALNAAGVGAGDEVIVPALTFAATAAAVCHAGAIPRFADVDPQTFALTSETVERQLNARTRAVIAVDFAGVPCDLGPIERLLAGRPVVIIEDAAHALGARWAGTPVGARAPYTGFSFSATKHVAACSGGALSYRDAGEHALLTELSDVGLANGSYARSIADGAPPIQEVRRVGYRYAINDVAAAIAVAQIENIDEIIAQRRALAARYSANLGAAGNGCFQLVRIPAEAEPSCYIMPVSVPAALRDKLRAYLAQAGVDTSVHYPNLLEQPAFRGMPGCAPAAARASARLVSLPLHNNMSVDDVDRVCELCVDFVARYA